MYSRSLLQSITLFAFIALGTTNAFSSGTISRVSTVVREACSVVQIQMTGYSEHKVIPVGEKEVLVAFKDTRLADSVYKSQTIVGDALIRGIEVAERPFHVTSILLQLHSPDVAVDLSPNDEEDEFRIEVRPGSESRVVASEPPVQVKAIDRQGEETGRESLETPALTSKDEEKTDDGRLFDKAENRRKAGEWDKAKRLYEKLIRAYPRSPYLDASYFNVASVVHAMHDKEISDHLLEISHRYQSALSRFPDSDHVPNAMLALGRLYSEAGQYFEALTYYDLLLKRELKGSIRAEALYHKGRILALTERPLMALRAFEKVTEAHESTEFVRKAKLETAKTLHDMKSFKRSLRILKEIQSEQPDMIYETPDIMLYFGYNYYELGRLEAARDAFSQVINYFPNSGQRDLVLARIADTYREDGLEDKAAKLYSLVARTYPESEAGIISLLRLAEIAEKQEARQPLTLKASETSPRTSKTADQIYRQIIETYPDSPLSQVAMLKLASLQKRKQEYEKAIRTLRQLLDRHPETQLKDNVDKVMQQSMLELAAIQRDKGDHQASVDTIAEMLGDHPESRLTREVRKALEDSFAEVLRAKNRTGGAEAAISYFEKRKARMPIAQMPSALLEIGKAYKALHLCEPAISALVAARRLYRKNDLPAPFLWALSECSYREGNHKLAKDVLSAFVSSYPEHEEIAKAHLWLAELLLADSQFGQTLEVCESGLKKTADKRIRGRFLSVIAKAHNEMGDHRGAVGPLNEVLSMLESDDEDVSEIKYNVYRELGRSYFRLGQSGRAVEAFERALELRPEGSHGYGLKFEIAKCYQSTAPSKAQSVLRDIVASGDPFWSKVAQARINEISLEQSVDRLGLNKS